MTGKAEIWAYVGTYTTGESQGIYTLRFDPASGALAHAGVRQGVTNPSFLAIEPQQRFLYAVNEIAGSDGQPQGAVTAFAIDAETGGLTLINEQPSHGGAPCHVSVAGGGRYVLVANYSTGSVAMFPVRDGGGLDAASDVVQHHGTGVNPERQEAPHAHSVTVDPTGQHALVADLGLDRVMVYRLELKHGKLVPNHVPWVEVAAGSGPRHLAFDPSGCHAYLINELNSTLTVFGYDGAAGTLTRLQTISTLPDQFAGENWCADVHVAPSGRFVYGSNRGHDTIVILEVDPATGILAFVGYEPTGGRTPRNFAIDPSGQFLLAANQDTSSIVTFGIDQGTGELTPTGQIAHVPTPVCITFGSAVA